MNKGLEFDDILIAPRPSSVFSRDEVDISVDLGKGIKLSVPIIAAPMAGIVGPKMILEIALCGGIGILHRFYQDSQLRSRDVDFLENNAIDFGVAVGLHDYFYKEALERRASIICIDVANGYLDSVCDFVYDVSSYIRRSNHGCLVMAGNVVTFEGASRLAESGADLIRVGIGSGGLCTTRKVTGIGIPQVSALQDCALAFPVKLVSDGGIKTSGDIVKAIACGADAVMIGSMFGKCVESDNNGKISGMASKEFQEQFYGEVKKSVEGMTREEEKTTTVKDMMNELAWGIRSACTYVDSRNLSELCSKSVIVEVK